ncbi:MAG: hypothetical protein M5U09_05155 [Gammaproteobacteria bacterium]|nr:hypothetical protein [Gammaproteobacteria bacterium]
MHKRQSSRNRRIPTSSGCREPDAAAQFDPRPAWIVAALATFDGLGSIPFRNIPANVSNHIESSRPET